MNKISGEGIDDNSDMFEFLSATAGLVGTVFDNSKLLAHEYLHGNLHGCAPAEYKAGLDLAIERGWLTLHDSGTYVRFTQAGAELFSKYNKEN